jgi:hypothetical protein
LTIPALRVACTLHPVCQSLRFRATPADYRWADADRGEVNRRQKQACTRGNATVSTCYAADAAKSPASLRMLQPSRYVTICSANFVGARAPAHNPGRARRNIASRRDQAAAALPLLGAAAAGGDVAAITRNGLSAAWQRSPQRASAVSQPRRGKKWRPTCLSNVSPFISSGIGGSVTLRNSARASASSGA